MKGSKVWGDSFGGSDRILTWNYVLLTVLFFASVFCFTEGVLYKTETSTHENMEAKRTE